MKNYFNLYYLFLIGIALFLWKLNSNLGKEVMSFYGFAENKETDINFNYPVAVGNIRVRPGEFVKANTPLLDIYRITAKEVMDDGGYRIAELRAKETIWRTDKENELKTIAAKKTLEAEKLQVELQKLKNQQVFEQSLYEGLNSVSPQGASYQPILDKIKAIEKELPLIQAGYDQQISAIQEELVVGKNPYTIERARIEAEQKFDEANKKQFIQLTAPTDGVIGNIYCKEEEHIPSYTSLLTFYEPNPTLVKGYIQEDLILQVAVQDSFLVRSTKDPAIFCHGVVIGLGSRIVEIPERLRKIIGLKTYGREILIAITPDNHFLQKEKVVLEFTHLPIGYKEATYPNHKVIVELKESLDEKK